VVIDLACDPPLARNQRAIAVEEAARVVRALGAAMVAARASRGVVAVRDAESEAAIRDALSSTAATAAEVVRVADAFPSVGIDRDVGCEGAWVLDGERALDVEAAALAVARAPRRTTVAGAVAHPGVVKDARTVGEAVAQAGALDLAWVALAGRWLDWRAADADDAVRAPLLLVCAPSSPHVARARTTLGEWLRRAASACEGCRACSDVCPVALDGVPLAPHEILWTLVTSRDDGERLASASACVRCGICDVACPSSLSPAALVEAVQERLPPSVKPTARGPAHPDRAGRRTSIDLLTMRAGLP